MIKTLVIDDEPLALQQLAAYVRKIPFLDLVAECQSAIEARDIINNERIDAIFVDINMPDMNGMDFVRSLAAPPLVVFTTAYSEYAVDGFKVDAVDYLLKPFGLDDFKRAAMRVKHRFELENPATAESADNNAAVNAAQSVSDASPAVHSGASSDDESIFLKTEHRVVRVNIADIRYIEGMSEYLKVHIEGQRPIVMLFSMKKMEERLPSHFLRIHRSYIVNMRHVQEVTKNRIVMDSDTYLPIGDMYKETLSAYLADKYFGR
ncbi:LytR/AlgR family response regulator transcription factor [Prevotella sp.]|uniref:LytR/AlgR family response regulator transcription factor n=1 Tax=Prevotella sp. TaxID=59823 RepID=UPI0026007B4B|nr:LytTR family DNA-binding domain-containing protein [Prevotella sp.]